MPSIHFTNSLDWAEFLRLADWLCREFDAKVVERYGGKGEGDKEYLTLRLAQTDWLLMRCYCPLGISLDSTSSHDLPAFERIATTVGAAPYDWKYRWVRFLRWWAREESHA